jgi:hypothetical protein
VWRNVQAAIRVAIGLDVDCAAGERSGSEPAVVRSLRGGGGKFDVEAAGGDELAYVTGPRRAACELGDAYVEFVAKRRRSAS